jgi:hypothetical protein
LGSTNGASLSRRFFELGRYDEAFNTIKSDQNIYFSTDTLVSFGMERAKAGDLRTARRFAIASLDLIKNELGSWDTKSLAGHIKLFVLLSNTAGIQIILDSRDEDERFESLVYLAAAYADTNNRELALNTLDKALDLPDPLTNNDIGELLVDAVKIYSNLQSRPRALRALALLQEMLLRSGADNHLYLDLFRHLRKLGEFDGADAALNRLDAKDEGTTKVTVIAILLESGSKLRAEEMLSKITSKDIQTYGIGRKVVELQLRLGKFQLAEATAEAISDGPDSYDQQSAYMQIADHYISEKKPAFAKKIIGRAFQKARQIQFAHDGMQSVGASEGSRKSIYLRSIAKRYKELGFLDQALDALANIYAEHGYAKELYAESIAEFVLANAKALPQKRANELLDRALAVAEAIDEDSTIINVRSAQAELFSIYGDKAKAANALAEVLEKQRGEYLEGYALISTGTVFHKYGLTLTDRLSVSLSKILEDYDL